MAHNLNIISGIASMMYVGEVPWHGLGQRLPKLATAAEAIEAAHLDYTVEKRQLFYTDPTGQIPYLAPKRFATVRTDTEDFLGDVGADYTVLQNKDSFSFFDAVVGEGQAIYETAGALGNGEMVWILAKMPGFIEVTKGDLIEKYVLLYNSHDGTGSVRAKISDVRVVCNNTLSMALSTDVRSEARIRHSSSVVERLKQAHEIIGLSNKLHKEVEQQWKRMAQVKMSDAAFKAFVTALLPDNEEAKSNTRRENQRSMIYQLHEVGKGAELARGTVWGAYNAVTEYVDHVVSDSYGGRDSMSQKLNSMWFGAGLQLKERAYTAALSVIGNGNITLN